MSDEKKDPQDAKAKKATPATKKAKPSADATQSQPSAQQKAAKDQLTSNQKKSTSQSTPDTRDNDYKSEQPHAIKKLPPADKATEQPPSGNAKANLFENKSMPRLDSKKTARKKRWLPTIAILLTLVTIGFVAWFGYQQYLMQHDWQQLETQLNQQIEQQASVNRTSQQTAQTGLQTASDNQRVLVQQTQLIEQLRQALTVTQERIRELSGRRNQDWMLAEAEYLIKLAEYKITLEKDKQTAIGLLKTADEKVMQIGDNSLIELRQAIAQDVANLQLVVAPDLGGIAVTLDSLADQVPSLNIVALDFESLKAAAEKKPTTSDEFSWQAMYQNFLQDFVEIKHHDDPRKPLMTPEQRGNLNANIQLALQQAQIAMFRGEQELYEASLQNAADWINEFFKLDQAATTLLKNIQSLKQTSINIDLPASLSSRKQIEAINQQRLYQWLESSRPTTDISNQPVEN